MRCHRAYFQLEVNLVSFFFPLRFLKNKVIMGVI